jgi:hypothetical protein
MMCIGYDRNSTRKNAERNRRCEDSFTEQGGIEDYKGRHTVRIYFLPNWFARAWVSRRLVQAIYQTIALNQRYTW